MNDEAWNTPASKELVQLLEGIFSASKPLIKMYRIGMGIAMMCMLL